jgi:hypothetical protein
MRLFRRRASHPFRAIAAPNHRRRPAIVAALIVVLCAGACSGKSTARPTEPTGLATTTTITSTGTSVSTTIPVATTTAPPLDVVDLAACPRDYPSASPSTSTTIGDLTQRLVPIDALNIRVCEYARSGSAPRLTRLSWLALSVARAFEAETNRLVSASEPAADCAGTPREGTLFLLTFAVDTETVNLTVGGCPVSASNGVLTAPVSARWYADLEQYTNDDAAASAVR